MVSFDRLDQVRTLARARAVEDFSYFVGAVLGLQQFDLQWCEDVQAKVLSHGVHTVLHEKQAVADRALQLWLVVLGLRTERVERPTETFSWLFPEHVAQRVAA